MTKQPVKQMPWWAAIDMTVILASQHVGMDREWQLSGHAQPFNQLLGAVDGKGRLPFR